MNKLSIIILHGWNLSGERFQPIVHELRHFGYTVYTPDLPGFGSSPAPDEHASLSSYVSFVESFLKEHSIRDFVLLGHSFGGRIGIKLASEKRTKLAALVLMGAPGFPPVSRARKNVFLSLSILGKLVFAFSPLSRFSTIAQKILYGLAHSQDWGNTSLPMKKIFQRIVAENLSRYLSKISVPTLLLWGEHDNTVPVSIAQKMLGLIPDSRLVIIKGARHGAPWTHQKESASEITKFLSSL